MLLLKAIASLKFVVMSKGKNDSKLDLRKAKLFSKLLYDLEVL